MVDDAVQEIYILLFKGGGTVTKLKNGFKIENKYRPLSKICYFTIKDGKLKYREAFREEDVYFVGKVIDISRGII